ncbi:MAG TPA: hypothetical protein VMF63_13395 [Opitutaceae bacterium]|nr:hypothetical protein [Opitutaceae bacterium]
MHASIPMDTHREVLDQDLQIIRVTLATILGDVREFSGSAATAMQEALEKLDRAQREFSRPPFPSQPAGAEARHR